MNKEVRTGEEDLAQALGFDNKEEFAFFEIVKKHLLEPEEKQEGIAAEAGAEYITQDIIDLAKDIALDVAGIVKENYVIDWTTNPTKTQDIERAILLMLTKKYFKQINLGKRKQLVQPLLQLAKKHYAVIY
jgi:type I restriction enzyme R subunit